MVMSENAVAGVKTITLNEPVDVIHNTVDIILVTEGRIFAFLPSLPKLTLLLDDLMMVSPKYSYSLEPGNEGGRFTLITLDSHDVEQFLGNTISVRCNSALAPNKNYDYIRMLVQGIARRYLDDAAGNRLEILSLYFALLSEIKKNFSVSVGPDPETSVKYGERMRKIVNLIEENFSREMTLSFLARELFLSPQYLSRFFSEHFHKSFTAYLNEVRLRHAASDLIETNYDVTKIAINNGFGSPASFNRAFRKYFGMSPGAYRKNADTPKDDPRCASFFAMMPSPGTRQKLSEEP